MENIIHFHYAILYIQYIYYILKMYFIVRVVYFCHMYNITFFFLPHKNILMSFKIGLIFFWFWGWNMTQPWFLIETFFLITIFKHSAFLWNIWPFMIIWALLVVLSPSDAVSDQQRSRSVTFSSQSHGALHCCRGNQGW